MEYITVQQATHFLSTLTSFNKSYVKPKVQTPPQQHLQLTSQQKHLKHGSNTMDD
jgi:hypothetical protein